MMKVNSIIKRIKTNYFMTRLKLATLRRVTRLREVASKQIPKVYTNNGEKTGTGEEILYRSIIYTLFYANFTSISLITNLEKTDNYFAYIDVKLILRAIIERCITQKFILTDPLRLAPLFLYWGNIEKKRFHSSREENLNQHNESLALDIDFEGILYPWSQERENDYKECVVKWESLVKPPQKFNRAKSWSGYSLAEMSKIVEMEDFYKLFFRETSWYTHGLISVADFFLKETDDGLEYSPSVTDLQKIECYLQSEKLFRLSFLITTDALNWNLSSTIKQVEEEKPAPFSWIWEFIQLHIN